MSLVMHERRPEWGVGLVTSTNDERLVVQFQDGKLRSFKKGFFHMLAPVEDDSIEDEVIDELKDRFGVSIAAKAERKRQSEAAPVMTFNEQLRVFRHLYPGGFQDETYEHSVRRDPDGRRLKRLREPAMDFAAEKLSAAALDEMIAAGDFTGAHTISIKVLEKTSLASPSKTVDPLIDMPPESHEAYARALRDLLWGEGEEEFEARYKAWLDALTAGGLRELTWPMVTVLPALVRPDQDIAVRRKVFLAQARTVTPNRTFKVRPAPRSYVRYRRMAEKVRERLVEAGFQPRDMMDVHQFIWETLRPKGQEILSEISSGF